MKAVCYSRYGDPDVLHLEDVPTAEPDAGEILVKVRAAEATQSDCELRSFRYAVKWFWLPLRLAIGVHRPRRRILGGVRRMGADDFFDYTHVDFTAVGQRFDVIFDMVPRSNYGACIRGAGQGLFLCVLGTFTERPWPSSRKASRAT